MKLARLKYFIRFVRTAPVTLFRMMASLIEVPGSWSNDLFTDLLEAWQNQRQLGDTLPDPFHRPARWFEYVKAEPRDFYRKIAKHVNTTCHPQVAGEGGAAAKRDVHGEVACPECGKRCLDDANLASHRAAKHGVLNELRRHVAGTICIACGQQFHEYERHYHHIRYNPRCAAVCRDRVPPMPDELVAAIMAAARQTEKERDKKLLRKPVVKTGGNSHPFSHP